MASVSHNRAASAHRNRLASGGLSRFEVRGLGADKTLIRELARRLSAGDEAAAALRADVEARVLGDAAGIAPTGGILAGLRRSPLVGADLNLARDVIGSRDFDL